MDTEIFKNKAINKARLLAYGFEQVGDGFEFSTNIVSGQMEMRVTVDGDGKLDARIFDVGFGEEYVLHLVEDATGSFVGQVRAEYDEVINDIASKCFDINVFKAEQSYQIIDHVRKTYGDELEFLWARSPDNAIWRRKDNKKWYAALLTVKADRIGLDGNGTVEILDLRIKPDELEMTLDGKRFFPGYHMNKKHWYTVLLDGGVPTDDICRRIDESYLLAKK
ncbi:MAG: MmcQ/YjbR family DNA-binding protein [Clostridia bacterium]|nr:MmcQ/YjbR family DNA-binding protein [Clostridia bacterium]